MADGCYPGCRTTNTRTFGLLVTMSRKGKGCRPPGYKELMEESWPESEQLNKNETQEQNVLKRKKEQDEKHREDIRCRSASIITFVCCVSTCQAPRTVTREVLTATLGELWWSLCHPRKLRPTAQVLLTAWESRSQKSNPYLCDCDAAPKLSVTCPGDPLCLHQGGKFSTEKIYE